jgi:hypothetical protein
VTSKPAFQTEVRIQAGKAHLKVTGSFNESSDFDPALAELVRAHEGGASETEIDMSGVSQINSIGVKKWISFVEALRGRFKLRFERISEMVVAQSNVISTMLGPPGTPIGAFAAPYLCGQCGKEFSRELRESDLLAQEDGSVIAPKLPCEACGGGLVFDEYEEEYFFFLQHCKKA